jgi:alkyl hydroperoxide reductase subunit AhpC
MTLQLGDIAPDFEVESTAGPIRFHRWLGSSWGILFSHARDSTPDRGSEAGALTRVRQQFDQGEVKLIGLSGDTVQSHLQWARDIRKTQGVAVDFPIIADPDLSVARLYGMLHPKRNALCAVRTLFVIDPEKRLRLTCSISSAERGGLSEALHPRHLRLKPNPQVY